MGRTTPTYRDTVDSRESAWGEMRRALRRPYQPAFDRLFEHARQFADAAGYCNATDPDVALLLSIALAHEHAAAERADRIDALDDRVGAIETDVEALDARLADCEARLDRLERRLDGLDTAGRAAATGEDADT